MIAPGILKRIGEEGGGVGSSIEGERFRFGVSCEEGIWWEGEEEGVVMVEGRVSLYSGRVRCGR